MHSIISLLCQFLPPQSSRCLGERLEPFSFLSFFFLIVIPFLAICLLNPEANWIKQIKKIISLPFRKLIEYLNEKVSLKDKIENDKSLEIICNIKVNIIK